MSCPHTWQDFESILRIWLIIINKWGHSKCADPPMQERVHRHERSTEVSKAQIQFLHQSAVPTGSCSRILSLTFHLCTRIPLLCNTPNTQVWPVPGVTVIISGMIFLSSPSQAEGQFISSSSSIYWNSSPLLVRDFMDIPRSSAILTQGKCNLPYSQNRLEVLSSVWTGSSMFLWKFAFSKARSELMNSEALSPRLSLKIKKKFPSLWKPFA